MKNAKKIVHILSEIKKVVLLVQHYELVNQNNLFKKKMLLKC